MLQDGETLTGKNKKTKKSVVVLQPLLHAAILDPHLIWFSTEDKMSSVTNMPTNWWPCCRGNANLHCDELPN